MSDNDSALPELEKVTPPTPRKPGRKPGQKTGEGKSKRLFQMRKAKTSPPTEEEKVEAFGKPDQPKPDEAFAEKQPEKRKTKSPKISASQFAGSIKIAHAGIAGMTGLEEWKLSDEEARDMAETLHAFLDEFGVEVSPKTAATLNLLGTWGPAYGKRMVAMRMRAARKTKLARDQANGQSAQSPPQPPPEPILDPFFGNQTYN